METVTLEKMKQQEHISNAIEWALQKRGEYPKRPNKPNLPTKHSSIEAAQYAIDLQVWEKSKQEYDEVLNLWKSSENEIADVIVEFIKDEAGLETVPKQYRDKLYSKAHEDGHSSGYYEVYLKLSSLIEIFE